MNELCLNEDEAAQGYNTYSVLKTGKDEYGKFPLRYLSFGENKLPLTGLLSSPFIAAFGLNVQTVRLPTHIIGILFPVLFYFATLSLTKNKGVALIAAFLSIGNIWLQTTSRHQHETVVLAAIVLVYTAVLFWKRPLPKKHIVILSALTFLGLYTYHSAKIIMPALVFYTVIYFLITTKKSITSKVKEALIVLGILSLGTVLFLATEFIVPNNRLGNLSYFTHPVFIHEIEEGRRLGGSPIFYNKLVYGSFKLLERSLSYFLPDYLLINSDPNARYGASYLPLLTFSEYFLFVSALIVFLYMTIIRKESIVSFWYLPYLAAFSVLSASLALPTYSSTRSYLLTIPIIILTAVGTNTLFKYANSEKRVLFRYSMITGLVLLGVLYFFNISNNWINYFDRYLNDPQTKGAWQCGMEEVSKLAWQNYKKYDHINISSPMGQPYIFLLFYGGPYTPSNYQKIARQMPYNKYGFWEQESFDKFSFSKEPVCKPDSKSFNIGLSDKKIQGSSQNESKSKIGHFYIYSFECL